MPPVSFEKIEQQAPELVNLVKQAQVNLSKANLMTQPAKVALCLDYSGSMSRLYSSGVVQRLAERVLALATQFDDDGNIDVFVFDTTAAYVGELDITNYKGGVDRLTRGRRMGTTNYAAAMKLVRDHYAGGKKKGLFRKASSDPVEFPAYVLFLTDGAPDSRNDATAQLVEASREGIFWQFVGVGSADFSYLEKLDSNVRGRLIDNANFFEVRDLDRVSDAELFEKMLDEFPEWIPQARQHGLIR